MKLLIDYLLRFGDLSQQHIDLITSKARTVEFRKDDYFYEVGKVPASVGYIVEGVLRISFHNEAGEDITRYFMDEDHMIANINCFDHQIPSTESIQAVTDCTLIVFSKHDWDEFSDLIAGWDTIISKIIQKALIEKLGRKAPLIEQDATTRYLSFLEKFPKMANRIPLYYLASYLGITQSSLSRIRKTIR
ncbi:MAG: Crp/Fnr family transcriptional regulator [Flavobacterium sp.]|nr:MAG: Crp/Fnr family transcriptional regulator [Flavobacterium sp.]